MTDAHVVGFYTDDHELVDRVTECLFDGVSTGHRALVVVTAAHRCQLEERLADQGASRADADGMVRFVDAAATLAQFMVDGVPDSGRFASVIGTLIDTGGGGPVRVYGEMVQLLWEAGNVNAALQLEGLWNDLAADHDFSLYCAYRSDTVSIAGGDREAVCRLHSALVGTAPNLPDRAAQADRLATAELAPTSGAPSRARRVTAEALLDWEWTGDHQAAVLIVSELSANAVVHARSQLRVCVTQTNDLVRISVTDLHPGAPTPRHPAAPEPTRRGLSIIATLADNWGYDTGPHGKEVWAEIYSKRPQPLTTTDPPGNAPRSQDLVGPARRSSLL
ncbi:MAG: MEDS domain-containing protein [Acidimicrobiales bacterium]|nr:MEDS domain-containing protein [Acidimicrobiales bacterium]